MDERRSLTDAALDREIQAALDVDPSPAFLARVRQRVAVEPAPAAWWRGPRVVSLVAAGAFVAAVIALWPGRDDMPGRVVPQPTFQRDAPAEARGSVPAFEVPAPAARPPQPARAATTRGQVADSAGVDAGADRFSVVILADNERQALQWLGWATRIEPPRPAAIVTSRDRAPEQEPDLAAVRLASPDMAPPVFESVSLE